MRKRVSATERQRMKEQRLVLIKERYRKLILEPRREIEMELFSEAPDPEFMLEVAD